MRYLVLAMLGLAVCALPRSSHAFTEGWEAGQGSWSAENGVWEVGTPTAGPSTCHGGEHCAGTILGGDYPFTQSRLISPPLQLGAATPLLTMTFWHWFAWGGATGGGPGEGVVQISVWDGNANNFSDWQNVGNVYSGVSGVWTPSQVDLTPYAGKVVRVAFNHLGNNAYSSGPGWFVDDIDIPGTSLGPSAYSLLTDWEQGASGWSVDNGVWEFGKPTSGPNGCHQGIQCAATVLDGNYPFQNSRLISPPIQLAALSDDLPFLFMRFWHWFAWGGATGGGPGEGVVQVSILDPATAKFSDWVNVSEAFQSSSGAWTLTQVNLSNYAGKLVKIAFFHLGANAYSTGPGWYIDEIEFSASAAHDNSIQYSWELPPSSADGVASGVSNAQGWAFSTAGTITSITLERGGQHFISLPCCAERDDVRNAIPGAPLLTGFSAAVNWGNLGNAASDLTLVIRDSAGNEKRETRTIQSVQYLSGVPFATGLAFTPGTLCGLADDDGIAVAECSDLSFQQGVCNGNITFAWNVGKQAFELVGGCH